MAKMRNFVSMFDISKEYRSLYAITRISTIQKLTIGVVTTTELKKCNNFTLQYRHTPSQNKPR